VNWQKQKLLQHENSETFVNMIESNFAATTPNDGEVQMLSTKLLRTRPTNTQHL
jgi:hypothetical protein